MNLVTDGLPALALGLEKGERDIMDRPPRPTKGSILNRDMQIGILVQGIVSPLVVLGAMALTLWGDRCGRLRLSLPLSRTRGRGSSHRRPDSGDARGDVQEDYPPVARESSDLRSRM